MNKSLFRAFISLNTILFTFTATADEASCKAAFHSISAKTPISIFAELIKRSEGDLHELKNGFLLDLSGARGRIYSVQPNEASLSRIAFKDDFGKERTWYQTTVLPEGPYTSIKENDLTKYGGALNFRIKNAKAEYAVDPRSGRIGIKELTFNDLSELNLAALLFADASRENSGNQFVIGGLNASTDLATLKSLNGIQITKIEAELKPGKSSTEGFLGKDENLISLLKEDNDLVVNKMGLTHQKLAEPLILFSTVATVRKIKTPQILNYHGQRFQVERTTWVGVQPSPFGDHYVSGADLKITNLKSGASLKYSELLGPMIYNYGFYEGHQTSYRLDPTQIVAVFGRPR